MTPARKLYLDNIRWMTVVLVVIYHVVYMFNGVQPFGVIGPFRSISYRIAFNIWSTLGSWHCCLLCRG